MSTLTSLTRSQELLESLLPYIKYCRSKGLPNAAYYVELIEGMLWTEPYVPSDSNSV